VGYAGEPKFEPIKGTSMEYATNTQDKVIELEGTYYLCLQGVWFMAPTPTGPWTTCMSVPQEIYTIPSSSPVYNVTYVTQTANPDGTVTANYTADIWARLSWAPPRERFLPMEVSIGGRHIVMVAITIPTREHTVAPITGATVIIIQRLTMTPPRELTVGNRLLMVLTDRQRAAPVTILIPALMPEALRSRRLMGAEAQHRHIIHKREPMLRHGKARARRLSGAAPMCHVETRALPWVIIQLPMVRTLEIRGRRVAKLTERVQLGETPRPVKLPVGICMRAMMVTFTRTPVTVGRSTTTEAGIP